MSLHRFIVCVLLAAASTAAFSWTKAGLPVPEFQAGFVRVISDYAAKYNAAENDLQKSALATQRHKEFEKLKGDPRNIKDWVGQLESMGTNGDGNAYIVVSLPDSPVTLSTWNNSFSDAKEKTLILQSSSLFATLAGLKPKSLVKFSGQLMRPKNITEGGRMKEPDFLFKFSKIEPLP